MYVRIRRVVYLRLHDGSCAFEDWLEGLGNSALVAAVYGRITRVRDGNFGDFKSVGGGVFELRLAAGPGIRIYYARANLDLIVLLSAGTKGTQERDIEKAKRLWKAYKHETGRL